MFDRIDELAVTSLRVLSLDAIEGANQGHPGMPMGSAPMAYTLFSRFMNYNPQNPDWFNRDRFVLSAGHGSALLYSLLHIAGYGVTMEDIKNFRKLGSKTPGHPEYGDTPGVDATTGPLGQGIATAVGMAMAERHLASTYNRENFDIVDHYTYCICGDGDLMEGISAEAISLAGHLKLGRLIVLYDSNDISLDGDLNKSFSENIYQRFSSCGWNYIRVEDGNNLEEIAKAIEKAKQQLDAPTLIEVKTTIGYGSPNKAGKSEVHGAPLGTEEFKLTKEYYGWPYEDSYFVPEEVYQRFRTLVKERGVVLEEKWNELFAKYKKAYPELAQQLERAIAGDLPDDWDELVPEYDMSANMASRDYSSEIMNALAKKIPYYIGGSADLASANKTMLAGAGDFMPDSYSGRNIWFGVREFAMGAILNGVALHRGLKVFGATFLVFSDYMRPAMRLAALMKLPVTYVFTHDSIAVGGDGPTHQPIEHLASLRAIPNLSLIRPADGNETAAAWKLALLSKDQPTALVLSRQKLPTIAGTKENAFEGVSKGAYIISKAQSDTPDALLLATGSEVNLAVAAQKELQKEGIDTAVISMPSWDRFEKQPQEYKDSVLPPNIKKRLAIEMASPQGWERYIGEKGQIIAVNKFGASGHEDDVMEAYGFSVKNVVEHVRKIVGKENVVL